MTTLAPALIVAVSDNGVIGRDGDLPWRLSADLRRFKALTMGHHLIMGRRTWDSIGRPLPGRTTVVLTRDPDWDPPPGVRVARSFTEALDIARDDDRPFVVGGAEVYRTALPFVDTLYVTVVHAEVAGDTQLPEVDWSMWHKVESDDHPADEKNQHPYTFEVWRRRRERPVSG